MLEQQQQSQMGKKDNAQKKDDGKREMK